jgi:fucose permease
MASPSAAAAPKISTGRLIIAAILAVFVYGIIAAMLGTILPSLKFTPDQKGYLGFAQALGLILASVSAGPLTDNKGKKTGLVISLFLIALALFLLPIGTRLGNYWMIMCDLFLLGFGGGVLVTSSSALVSDVAGNRRASMLNFFNLFFGLGGLATPAAAYLLGSDMVRLIYVAASVTAVVLILNVATAMPPPTGERGFKLAEAGPLLSRPALWLLSLFMFLYVACEVGVWNWLVQHLVAQGIAERTALSILSLGFALGLLLGRVVVSRILIKVSAVTVTLGAAILMAVTTFLMLNTSDPAIAWVAVFCAGLAMAPVFPTTLAIVGDVFPIATGTAMGIVITCGWIGLAVSSRIIGAIAGGDTTRLKTALLVLPVFSVGMIVVNLIMRPMIARARAATT